MPAGDPLGAAVERTFRSALRTVREQGGYDLTTRFGGPSVVGPLIMFRHALGWPDRLVTWAQFATVVDPHDPAEQRGRVDRAAAVGLLALDASGLCATETGHAFLRELWAVQGVALESGWAAHGDRVARLLPTLDRLIDGAAATGGPAFAALTPPFEPPEATAGTRVFGRLDLLRRADAARAAAFSRLPPGERSVLLSDLAALP